MAVIGSDVVCRELGKLVGEALWRWNWDGDIVGDVAVGGVCQRSPVGSCGAGPCRRRCSMSGHFWTDWRRRCGEFSDVRQLRRLVVSIIGCLVRPRLLSLQNNK